MFFERPAQKGKLIGNLAGHPGALSGRVERVRVVPYVAKQLLHVRVGEVVKENAIAGAIGELVIAVPLPGEVRVYLEHIAHVTDDDEGRQPSSLAMLRA